MNESVSEAVVAARAMRGAPRAPRFWLDAAAVLAVIFAADVFVLVVLKQWTHSMAGWRAALLDALSLMVVLAVPVLLLLRAARRSGATRPAPGGDEASRQTSGALKPYRQYRLRMALYGTLVVIGVAAGWQVWQARQVEAARQVDAELITLAGHQRMQSQRMGRLAALASLAPRNAGPHLVEIEQSRKLMEAAARRMNELIERQRGTSDAPSDDIVHLLSRVGVQQESLWENAGYVAQVAPDMMPPIALGLQAEAEFYLRDMDALAAGLQAEADARSRRAEASNHEWALLMFALLACLAVAVFEPLVRALRRQHDKLVTQAAETRYLALAAQRTSNGVVFTDREHRIVWVNDGFTRLSGFTLAEVAGCSPGDVLGATRSPPEALARVRQAVAERREIKVALCNRSRDGREYWVEMDLQPLDDEHGAPSGYVEVLSDITDQVLQREHMATLIEAMPVGMVVHDGNGDIAECNPAACRMLGLDPQQLIGRGLRDPRWRAVHEDGSPFRAATHPVLQSLSRGEPVGGVVMGVTTSAGAVRWISLDTQPLRGRDGKVESVISCFVDLTEKRAQEARLGLMVEGAALGTWELRLATGVARFNEQWTRMLGYEPDQVEPSLDGWRGLVHPGDLPDVQALLEAHLRDPATAFRAELRMRHADGRWAWVLTAGAVVERDSAGQPVAMSGVHLDIDRAKRAEAATHEARDRAERALLELRAYQIALDKHAIVSVTDPSGAIKHANERFCQVSQYSRDELIGQTHRIVSSGAHSRQFWAEMWRSVTAGRSWNGEVCSRARDGSLYWADTTIVPVQDAQSRIVEHVAIRTDITQRKQLEEQLRSAALTDGLTKLPNRISVLDKLHDAVLRARRLPDYRFAVLYMDFDRFKLVNDSLGHDVGDELLRQIALRLRLALREGDALGRGRGEDAAHTAARIGGDEFVILLDGIHGVEDAELVARRLLFVLSQPYQIGAHEVHSSASIGVVASDTNRGDADALLRDADTAMYEAKRAGRGRYVLFDATMHERVARTLDLENDLRHALQNDEFYVVYQPIVDLGSGALRGVEALARWQHPQRGNVPPLEFIPVAEETGLITALGARVLRDACDQFMAWQGELGDGAPQSVAVNLSRAQLGQDDLDERVQHELLRSGMPPQCLRLEVTESLAMQDGNALAMLHRLKALGVSLALDDFGTGYSSLACLHEIPVDVVKIDRSFVSQLEQNDHRRVLIQATVLVARALGIRTVAEGVETAGQAQLLEDLGCSMAQGYLFGRPLTPQDFAQWRCPLLEAPTWA